MPDDKIRDEEAKEFIERVVSSEALKSKKELQALLRFLAESRDRILSPLQLAELHLARRRLGGDYNDDHARERASTLRKCLRKYKEDNPDDPIQCELPNADEIGGYQLKLWKITEAISACQRFWAPHAESKKDISVICDPLLFYFDFSKAMAFRFVNTNIESMDREAALGELRKLHSKEYKKTLLAGHFYMDVGSVEASENIRKYFRSSGIEVPMVLSKDMGRQWPTPSPVIIGTVRTNFLMRRMFRSDDTMDLAYRLDVDRFGWVNIREPREEEVAALKAIKTTVDTEGSFLTPSPEMTIGIVSRIPNPKGTGVMTFISSDGTFTTREMAAALTNEAATRAIFAQMDWRLDRPVPATFELMFLVKLWPAGTEDEGARAKLLCGRS